MESFFCGLYTMGTQVLLYYYDSQLVSAYPFVAKTLRDASKPKNQRKTPNHHCCSIAMQNEGLGYLDLNALLQEPCNLEFTLGKILKPSFPLPRKPAKKKKRKKTRRKKDQKFVILYCLRLLTLSRVQCRLQIT